MPTAPMLPDVLGITAPAGWEYHAGGATWRSAPPPEPKVQPERPWGRAGAEPRRSDTSDTISDALIPAIIISSLFD